jgi:hypothetical protein
VHAGPSTDLQTLHVRHKAQPAICILMIDTRPCDLDSYGIANAQFPPDMTAVTPSLALHYALLHKCGSPLCDPPVCCMQARPPPARLLHWWAASFCFPCHPSAVSLAMASADALAANRSIQRQQRESTGRCCCACEQV